MWKPHPEERPSGRVSKDEGVASRVNTKPLRERWLNWRNRLIANPRFQRWAAGFPFTRRIAQKRASALFDLCAGFVYSQILLACVRLDLFERLREGPRSIERLAQDAALPHDAMERLLRAAASLDLLQTLPDGRYALADLGAAMIGNPSVAAFVEHHELLYDDLRDPLALLRGETQTRLSRFWPYAGDAPGVAGNPAGEDAAATYSALMSRSQALVAEDILDAYPLTGRTCLLDVGGGEGTFACAAAARAPHLRVHVFDLPPVAARATRRFEAQGLAGRAQAFGGSFLDDSLPRGADVISLVRVLHDHDDESALAAMKAAYAALPPGGDLVIAEPMADAPGARPMGDAYFGFYLLAMGRGKPRRPVEIELLLRKAGFSRFSRPATRRPLLASMIVATKL